MEWRHDGMEWRQGGMEWRQDGVSVTYSIYNDGVNTEMKRVHSYN